MKKMHIALVNDGVNGLRTVEISQEEYNYWQKNILPYGCSILC